MSDFSNNEQMLDMYLFETSQNIEQLESCILDAEKANKYTPDAINEIFRIMHTIKGSSAMMLFNNIAELAHKMEDLFYFIREQGSDHVDTCALSDLLLKGVDFIKIELEKYRDHHFEENSCQNLMKEIMEVLSLLKKHCQPNMINERPNTQETIQYYIVPDLAARKDRMKYCYKAVVFFEDGCEMENIRAYTIIHNLKPDIMALTYQPYDILENQDSTQIIRENGFHLYFKTDKSYQEMQEFFNEVIFLKSLDLTELKEEELAPYFEPQEKQPGSLEIKIPDIKKKQEVELKEKDMRISSSGQNLISVNVAKLDRLMDLVGEMVISEALVTQNPDLEGLELDNFLKAAAQHHKIICEVQDMVMSIRMVSLSATFHKMHRLVRDMNKNLNKETELLLIGEDTEVDKNIIEHISDPLMHLVRNCVDHGIEGTQEREEKGKSKTGRVILEAKNSGSDVLILIRDDGRGLNKDRILSKARELDLFHKPESELTEREIFNMILLPGFSTKENVSEYSGRGVGMDVVTRNIEAIGGTVLIESKEGVGTCFTLKLPLTLAIIDGMNIRVGEARYTIPITAIKESFRPNPGDIITDPDGNEMIMLRGSCFHIRRLHQLSRYNTENKDFMDGIFIMVEQGEKSICLFADELLGQQQVVIKALPEHIRNIKKIRGISGCTLLGDGNISLILDIAELVS